MKFWFLSLPVLILPALTVHAGWILEGRQQEGDNPPVEQTTQLAKEGLRMESSGQLVIFQSAGKKLIMADPESKTYQVLDRERMKALVSGMGTVLQQMQDAMAALTPEQKALMDKAMGGSPMPGAGPSAAPAAVAKPPAPEYRKLAESVTVGPWTTTHYEVIEGGVKTSEIWVAPAGALPIDRDLIKLFTEMGLFFKELFTAIPVAAVATDEPWSLELGGDGAPSGIPVKELVYQEGRAVSSWEITAARPSEVPPERFAIPEGYTEARAFPSPVP